MNNPEQIRPLTEYPNINGHGYDLDSYNDTNMYLIPSELNFATVDTLDDTYDEGIKDFIEAAYSLRDGWEGGFAGLYLYGKPGNGKSHAAISLARIMADKEAEVSYVYAPRDVMMPNDIPQTNMLREGYWTKSNYRNTVLRGETNLPRTSKNPPVELDDKRVLILDDLRPGHSIAFGNIVDEAHQRGALVIVTSNFEDPFRSIEGNIDISSTSELINDEYARLLNPDAVKAAELQRKKIDKEASDSTRSRLAGGFRFIRFQGPDRRIENSFWSA